jgi:hypothetical protein
VVELRHRPALRARGGRRASTRTSSAAP